ncbi:MAG TPA: hypothetical protein VEU33_29740 [Archangium sp.]|nr:hypothetical protein [Archangium sp.]
MKLKPYLLRILGLLNPVEIRRKLAEYRQNEAQLAAGQQVYESRRNSPEAQAATAKWLESMPGLIQEAKAKECAAETDIERAAATLRREMLESVVANPSRATEYPEHPLFGLGGVAQSRKKLAWRRRVYVSIVFLGYVVGFGAVLAGISLLQWLGVFQWILDVATRGGRVSRTLAAFGVVLFGGMLFLFRKYFRRSYAITELAVAAVTGYHALEQFKVWTDLTSWIPLAGAVYIVVRGFDNLMQGNEDAKRKQQTAGVSIAATSGDK